MNYHLHELQIERRYALFVLERHILSIELFLAHFCVAHWR